MDDLAHMRLEGEGSLPDCTEGMGCLGCGLLEQ
jgi:hypothetical protein